MYGQHFNEFNFGKKYIALVCCSQMFKLKTYFGLKLNVECSKMCLFSPLISFQDCSAIKLMTFRLKGSNCVLVNISFSSCLSYFHRLVEIGTYIAHALVFSIVHTRIFIVRGWEVRLDSHRKCVYFNAHVKPN